MVSGISPLIKSSRATSYMSTFLSFVYLSSIFLITEQTVFSIIIIMSILLKITLLNTSAVVFHDIMSVILECLYLHVFFL